MSDTNERSVASTGSVGEPVAWGVLRVGGGWVAILANEVQAETSRKSWDRMENWVHEVVPLFRSPPLTAAEREAVEYFSEVYGPQYLPPATEAAYTLRGLLERMK